MNSIAERLPRRADIVEDLARGIDSKSCRQEVDTRRLLSQLPHTSAVQRDAERHSNCEIYRGPSSIAFKCMDKLQTSDRQYVEYWSIVKARAISAFYFAVKLREMAPGCGAGTCVGRIYVALADRSEDWPASPLRCVWTQGTSTSMEENMLAGM